MDKPRRALALIRVSKERDDMTSPEVQRHAIDTLAKQLGVTVVDYVEGIDESGSRAKSAWWPRLDQSIDRMAAGEIDDILVWKFSRIGRQRLRWAIALDRVDTLGGQIISATEPIESSTASGRFARGILGEVNAMQAEQIGETWKDAHARRLRDGVPATGRPRFGYHWHSTYTINPQQAPVVREMYRRVIAGHGFMAVTIWVNEQGHRTRYGNPWNTSNLRKYMDHGFPAGFIWSKGALHPGAHEPIIDRDTWDAYLARRAGMVSAPRGSVRMLSGLLKCGTCGGPMTVTASRGGSGKYACAARARGSTCDAPMSIEQHIAQDTVSKWVTSKSLLMSLRDAEERELRQRVVSIEDREALARMIRRNEERLSTLTLKLVDDVISEAAYEAAAAKLNAELEVLKVRHTQAAPRPESRLTEVVPQMVESWPQASAALQNRIARTLIDRVVVHPGRGADRLEIIPRWGTGK